MESNELMDVELREIMKPRDSYWARIRESVSDYRVLFKNEVVGAVRNVRRKSDPLADDGVKPESTSSRTMLLPSFYESHQRSSYGSISSPRGYGNSSMDGNLVSASHSRSRSRSSSHSTSNSSPDMDDSDDLLHLQDSNELIRIVPRGPENLYPIIMVNDQYQGSTAPNSPTTPFGKASMAASSRSKLDLNIPPIINSFHAGPQSPVLPELQNFNFLTVEPMDGGPSSPSRKSSGFLSGCPSPTPTMNTSFELQSRDTNQEPETFTWGRWLKVGLLMGVLVAIASVITLTSETELSYKQITVSREHPVVYPIKLSQTLLTYYPILTVSMVGAFVPSSYKNFTDDRLFVSLQKRNADGEIMERFGNNHKWEIPIFAGRVGRIGRTPEIKVQHEFNLKDLVWDRDDTFSVIFSTNADTFFPFATSGRLLSSVVESGVIFGGAVVVGLYILIIFELVNRTLAAMLAAAASIGSLAYLNERPTTQEMVSWLDMDTLILLFSMMVMVSLLCETGFFDYAAYLMYKIANGHVWVLITGLCMFTAVVSAFLDNVTTILLMTPTTIRICEAMELNPVPVLISIVLFSNIGGAVTPVGDPPNVIISNNQEVMLAGIDFATFSLHMLLGIVPVTIVAYIQLRVIFRDIKSLKFSEPYEIAELRREIEVWTRAANSLSSYSRDESHVRALLLSKILHLRNKLKVKIRLGGQSEENYKANLAELEVSCKIRDWTLLVKCGLVLSVVIIMFFLHSVPQVNLSMGWTALLGTVFLLILADRRELEGIFSRVEWSTLIFFSALFVVMEGVSRLGLLEWIGGQTEAIILTVNEESRLTVAILLILWVSGIASAFIDNIPFTTMMVQIVTRISDRVDLPLQPLIWALAFGTCLGGNGTLIGASSNVVCAGLADQHGYRFTFMEYFRIGFPMMLVSLLVATLYLVVCHTLLGWNS